VQLPGVVLAALATLALGVVLGPEAPLIAIGGGLGVLAVRLAKRDAPPTTSIVMAAAGSFAAISTLFGSPILGAFLLMEASGLGGPVMGLILVPGLLAAGIGFLIFDGLNAWTGLGAFSLSIPDLPKFSTPDVAEFGWAIVIGIAAAFVGMAVYRLARWLRPLVTKRGSSTVLFSGQSALPSLVQHASSWTAGALVLLVLCKAVAYGASMSSFRGGPVFPSLFIGAAGGMALSHVGGLPLVPAVAMGIGAMCVAMLKLPLTSVLLGALLVSQDAAAVMPLVIVAVTVCYVVTAHITPAVPAVPAAATEPAPAPAPATPA
jgi:H+/Cl- antiporter ClcA